MHESHDDLLSQMSLFSNLPHPIGISIVIAGILLLLTSVARYRLIKICAQETTLRIPASKLTYFNFFEILAEQLFVLTKTVLGDHDAPRFFPLVGSLFVFIFFSNLVGLIPGFLPPTDNLNTTLALGFFVFIYYNIIGFQTHGKSYFKHFLGPLSGLAPLMLIIELSSHLFRPLSLALRLKGNILGDHIVLGVFSSLVPFFLPIIFYGLGVFVAFLQAFVFCLMTMVYISLSTAHDH